MSQIINGASGGMLFVQTADSTTYTNSTSAQSMVGTGNGSVTLPANYLTVGKSLFARMAGIWNTAAAPGTITINILLGGVTLYTQTLTLAASITTNLLFDLPVYVTCRSTGSSGTVAAQAFFNKEFNSNGVTGNTSSLTINTTQANTFDIQFVCNTASISNTFKSTHFWLQALN